MTARPRPAEMDAALLRDFGELTVQRVPVPQPGPGEVLCRVLACGICGTGLKIVAGDYRGTWPPSLPFIIGHEWSGEVAALGPGTERSGLAVGDRVVAENHTGCGACPMCRAGRYNLCERVREPGFKLYGHTAPGALAEYAVRPAVALHPVPPQVSDVAAALVNQGALTVHAARPGRPGRPRSSPGAAARGWSPRASSAAPRWWTTAPPIRWPPSAPRPAAAGWTTSSTARATRRCWRRPCARPGAAGRSRCSAWRAAGPRSCRWTRWCSTS